MEDRIKIARCRALLIEHEEIIEAIIAELIGEEDGKPNTGTSAFLMAKQVIDSNGYKRGVAALLARIKKHGGKQQEGRS